MKTKLLVLPLMLAGLVLAQPPGGGFRRGQANGTPPTAADIATRRVQMLTKFLDLTSSQQTQISTLLTNQEASLALNAPTLKTDRTALLDAIKANDSGQIDVLTGKIGGLDGQQSAIRAKTAASIYALLDVTQKTKVGDALRGILGGGGFGFGFGRGPR